ncbi:hypothetical protein X977_4571 [Burkholderia pseudomallei MSHR7504]|nr:hypothetical protein X977_4571 [Burkholderia pseudomallei MSHR7504]
MTKMSPKRDGRPAMRAPRALEHRARRSPKQRKGAEEPKAVNALAGGEGEGKGERPQRVGARRKKRPDRGSCPAKVR